LNRDDVDRAPLVEEEGVVVKVTPPLAVEVDVVGVVCSLETPSLPLSLWLSLADNGSAVVGVGLLSEVLSVVVVVLGDKVLLGTGGESICAKAIF
jgi:hypothetical protein